MTKKKSCIIFSIIGILFIFFCMTERELAASGNIIWDGSWILKLLVYSLVLGTVLGSLLCLALLKMEAKFADQGKEEKIAGRSKGEEFADQGMGAKFAGQGRDKKWQLPRPGILFSLSWVCTMICWLPGYLAYYPGINAYDFLIQYEQIKVQQYNAHHPLVHTLLMEGFIRLGDSLGSGTFGFTMYILLQMSVLAAALAGGIALLRKREVKSRWLILLQVFNCLFPFHWYMSLSATKDTLFTAFILLQLLMLCGLLDSKDKPAHLGHKKSEGKPMCFGFWDAGYILFSVLMLLFRNNGLYAMAVLAVFILMAAIFGKKERCLWVKILAETAVGMAVGSILLSAVFNVTGAVQGDKREMLSMPIQQLARTMVYHGGVGVLTEDDNTIEDVDKALINEFILYEAYINYRPDISDPVKGNTNTYVFVYRMKDFLSTYVRLFLKYPGEYVNAVLAVNAGYLSPFDESHAYINVNGRDVGLGYVATRWIDPEPNIFNIHRESKWPWLYEKMQTFADENMHMKLPIIKYLLVPGSYLWFYLILAAWLLIHKKYRLLLPFALILGYYATLILGPAVQMRYLYPLMTALPYLAVWAISIMSKGKNKQ